MIRLKFLKRETLYFVTLATIHAGVGLLGFLLLPYFAFSSTSVLIGCCASGILISLLFAWLYSRDGKKQSGSNSDRLLTQSRVSFEEIFQMGNSIENFSINANRQAINVRNSARIVSEVDKLVEKNVENAHHSQETSGKSLIVAEKGQARVKDMIQAISRIDQNITQIVEQIRLNSADLQEIGKLISDVGDKTKVINEIVFQTKLLSFNASVEAARSGEHGKGFSVVATEIGNLARMSGEAANQINKIVGQNLLKINESIEQVDKRFQNIMEESRTSINAGMETATSCGDILQEIVGNVEIVSRRVFEIVESSEVQAAGVHEVLNSIEAVNEISRQNESSALAAIDELEKVSIGSARVLEFANEFCKSHISLQDSDLSGITQNEILIGMSNALTGAAGSLGLGMKIGSEACFSRVNSTGGVAGRKVKTLSQDDAYDPQQTVNITRQFLTSDRVFALFGYVGTGTSIAVIPLINQEDVPFFAPFTGAQRLRSPVNANIFNIRASYGDEAEKIAEYLIERKGLKKIGLFIQDDAYCSAGETAITRALKKRNIVPCSKGIYKKGTIDVDLGVSELKNADTQAVVMVGTSKACAQFVRKSKEQQFSPVFLNLSFVGTGSFMLDAGQQGEGVYITQVVPSPWDATIPIVHEYQQAMKNIGNGTFDYASLEGFISARAFIEALRSVQGPLNRRTLKESMEKMNVDLGGFLVSFSSNSHCGSRKIWLTRIEGGKVVAAST